MRLLRLALFSLLLFLETTYAQSLPLPSQISLGADERRSSFITELGPMELRWQRREESCFGKSPARAVADAARAVNRAIKSARFPINLKSSRRDWSLLFIDSATLVREHPSAAGLGAHAGFMLPPNRIYLITDNIARDCVAKGTSMVADAELARVLLHEMGHVIEYLLLRDQFVGDHERAEGFAAWFEMYSSDFAAVIPTGSTTKLYHDEARRTLGAPRTEFQGSFSDYARSAVRFDAIVHRKGIAGLMSVYEYMLTQQVPFTAAVEGIVRWDADEMDREVERLLR